MTKVTLRINAEEYDVDIPDDMPLLWVLRDKLNKVGTKYGCGIGACGACTVLVDGLPTRSCLLPAANIIGRDITTIEGLDPDGNHPVQKAWSEIDVPQCGYCQAGQIMTAHALLEQTPQPTSQQVDSAMSGVLCRCGTYSRIRQAISLAARYLEEDGKPS